MLTRSGACHERHTMRLALLCWMQRRATLLGRTAQRVLADFNVLRKLHTIAPAPNANPNASRVSAAIVRGGVALILLNRV